ncbi:hypothetical protein PC123_g6411 [Phytophthora cactorum]|nr:hypothetical protein PC123_g6411 [Phytophthora cactorum]
MELLSDVSQQTMKKSLALNPIAMEHTLRKALAHGVLDTRGDRTSQRDEGHLMGVDV